MIVRLHAATPESGQHTVELEDANQEEALSPIGFSSLPLTIVIGPPRALVLVSGATQQLRTHDSHIVRETHPHNLWTLIANRK